jgi:microsomal epoxide hydrolase
MTEPFRIAIDQTILDDLNRRLDKFRPAPSPESSGWADGCDKSYLAELVNYWRHEYDWRLQEAALNRFKHFTAEVKDTTLHFIHEKGDGLKPLPLVLAHGWPDGFQRFAKLIPMLTNPGDYGASPEDAFDVVVPSLPGFGFSPRQAHGTTLPEFGNLFHALMTDVLGYKRYGAHGGDIGSVVCDQLCHQTKAVVGVHFVNVPLRHTQNPPKDLSAAEKVYLVALQRFQVEGGGYMHLQRTRPWTPAAALNDSPAGLAAWIVEKFYAWSDCGGQIESRFSKDELLTNIMLYWVTQSIGTSFLAYRDMAKPAVKDTSPVESAKARDNSASVPCGFAVFPKEILNAPRQWAERFYDVRSWTDMRAGGHFAALEEPEQLAEDIRAFFRPLRQSS